MHVGDHQLPNGQRHTGHHEGGQQGAQAGCPDESHTGYSNRKTEDWSSAGRNCDLKGDLVGHSGTSAAESRILRTALVLNGAMFVVGLVSGLIADSLGLVADSLDMLADAGAYGLSLAAIGRSDRFKGRVALLSGTLLLLLGCGVLLDAARRAIGTSEPESAAIIVVATLSLAVNAYVIRTLTRFRKGEVHLRAAWIFTRADVVANVAVITSGLLVLATGSRYPDLVAGFGVGCYVVREAWEILSTSRSKAEEHSVVG